MLGDFADPLTLSDTLGLVSRLNAPSANAVHLIFSVTVMLEVLLAILKLFRFHSTQNVYLDVKLPSFLALPAIDPDVAILGTSPLCNNAHIGLNLVHKSTHNQAVTDLNDGDK